MKQLFFSLKRWALTLAFLLMPAISLYAGPKENKQFLLAMQACNLKKAEKWLRNGANVDAINSQGYSALLRAAEDGNMDAARFLLENDADVNKTNEDLHTPLMCAASCGKEEVAELLLKHGANTSLKSWAGKFATEYANQHKQPKIERMIVEAEEARARMEQDANYSASETSGAAQPNRATGKMEASPGTTPAFAKTSASRPVASPYCTAEMNPNEATQKLFNAAESGNMNEVELLLAKGADLKAVDDTGATALMYATVRKFKDIAKLLLAKGANPNVADNEGFTALILATASGDTNIVDMLLQAGANVDTTNSTWSNKTPLIIAINRGYKNMAKLLLANEANPNAVDNTGATALMYATAKGDTDIVELLLAKGADTQIKSKTEKTAAQYARENKQDDIAKMIIQAGVKKARMEQDANDSASETSGAAQPDHATGKMEASDDNEEALSSGSSSTVPYPDSDSSSYESLLPDSEDAYDVRDAKGRTELIDAVLKGSYSDVYYLLEGTCDPNIPSKRTGQTPLMYAIKKRLIDIVEVLLEYNANPTQANNTGQTPLMYAADIGDAVIVEKLLKSDAKRTINAVDKDGISALTRAVDKEHTEVVQLLLKNSAELNPEGQGKWTPIRQAIKNKDEDIILAFLLHARERNDRNLAKELHAKIMAKELHDVLIKFAEAIGELSPSQ